MNPTTSPSGPPLYGTYHNLPAWLVALILFGAVVFFLLLAWGASRATGRGSGTTWD
ncbi:MAG TPA: hypothetical protein VF516_12435 [Kofleriaceae bacterium]